MIKKFVLSTLSLSMLAGCLATPPTTSSGTIAAPMTATEAYMAKVAFCSDILRDYDEATQFVGLERTMPPEERKAIKDKAWQKWQNDIQTAKSAIEGKTFFLRREVKFGNYDETKNRFELLENEHHYIKFDYGETYHDNALPNRLINNTFRSSVSMPVRPESAPDKWLYSQYVNSTKANRDIYVINSYSEMYDLKLFTYEYGSQGGRKRFNNNSVSYGVFFNMQPWMRHERSPFSVENARTYFDASGFDFFEKFGVYPDTGNVKIYVDHFYQVNSCEGKLPSASIKEVVISAPNQERNRFQTPKEIIRIML